MVHQEHAAVLQILNHELHAVNVTGLLYQNLILQHLEHVVSFIYLLFLANGRRGRGRSRRLRFLCRLRLFYFRLGGSLGATLGLFSSLLLLFLFL